MSELDKKILATIAERRLTPRPALYFLARRSVLWTLAALSVLLGAMSVSLALFAVSDLAATGGRGLDEMPLDDVLLNLPYVWLGSMVLFVASAVASFRQTPRGYRFRTLTLVATALVASLFLGGMLHVLGAGEAAHVFLRDHVPLYDSLTRSAETRRNAPAHGFLAGTVTSVDAGKTLTMHDFDGHDWTVEIQGAKITVNNPELQGEDLAIDGAMTGPSAFRARSIRDWD